MSGKFPPMEERFWSRVAKAGPDECWLWTGELNNKGYGVFYTYAQPRRKKHYAHRVSLRLDGRLVEDLAVLHSCDNPPCVNPSHLRPGTQAENMQDARKRGRMNLSGLALGGRRPIRFHGTMSCYRRGCRDESKCPGDETGLTCTQANRDYYRAWSQKQRRQLRDGAA